MHNPYSIKIKPFRATYFYPLGLLALAALCFLFVDIPFLEKYGPHANSYRKLFQVVSLLIYPPFHLLAWSFAFFCFRFSSRAKKLTLPLFEIAIVQGLSVAFVRFSKLIFGRTRPESFLQNDLPLFDFFSSNSHFHSFPSGHTMAIFALAASISYFYPKKRFYLIFGAFLLASSRVLLLKHFPSDLFATAVIGISIAHVIHHLLHNIITGSQIDEKSFAKRSP